MTRADSLALAIAAFDSTVYDTLQWATADAAVQRGGLVYRVSCIACHAEGGRGGRGFIFEGDTLRPPSFTAAGWALAKDPVGLRRRIFSGAALGMPYWGLVGMSEKDVDAVARYITEALR
jgi:mono/diheme cytochrome c family protein